MRSVLVMALLALGLPGRPGGPAAAEGGRAAEADRAAPDAAPDAAPLRYPDVEPVFASHCASCHDARQANNPKAQKVFEMSSYPFATERPATLIRDLQNMVPKRGALTAAQKKAVLDWLAAGALDAKGKRPGWR